MRVAVIGTGYVGLTTGVALAYIGHQVTAVDKDERKLALLAGGGSPIYEPGLALLLAQAASRLRYTSDTSAVVGEAEIIFIAVGTPPRGNGEADVRMVDAAAREVAAGLRAGGRCVIVMKSTVPVGTNHRIAALVRESLAERGIETDVEFAANPEFLREGVALSDTLYPDRIVIGAASDIAVSLLSALYRPILDQTLSPPAHLPRPDDYHLPHLITTDPTSAEMIKYTANAFLPVKISFINEIAGLCERVGADVTEVARGIGVDARIGRHFLSAGLGWGGSCFPKDTTALLAMARRLQYSLPILDAACAVNQRQRQMVLDKLHTVLQGVRGRTIGVLGLAFKPNTDDVRESPALEIIRALVEAGAVVRAHDPVALDNARQALQDPAVEYVEEPEEAARGAHALVLATEWRQYRELDLRRLAELMATPILLDGRNLFHPATAREAGFHYLGIGR